MKSKLTGPTPSGLSPSVEALVAHLEVLLNLAQMPRSLADCGVKQSMIPTLAEEAARQWTASFNPRPIGVRDFVALYEQAFEPRGDGKSLES